MPLPFSAGRKELGPHQANVSPTNTRSVPIPSISQQAPIANIIQNRDLIPRLYFVLHFTTVDSVSAQLDSIGDPALARQSHEPNTLQIKSSDRKPASDQTHRLACTLLLCLLTVTS
jgi:hypothetical protein